MKILTKQNFNYFFIAMFLVLFLTSCASREEVVYFSEMSENQKSSQIDYHAPILVADDLIEIGVVAVDMSAVGPFNAEGVSSENTKAKKTYLIDQLGTVEFPIIGVVKLAGLTRLEAIGLLEKKIEVYVKNPIVSLRLMNFKVTVIGEVSKPGTFHIENEKITLLEALGLAGDMTIYGERENVLVIREIDGKKSYTRIDMTTDEVFNSPVYYLVQNDVVYIEPNGSRMNQSKANMRGIVLPILAIIISAATVVAIYTTR